MKDIKAYCAGAMSIFFRRGEYEKATRWRDYANNELKDAGISVFDPTVGSEKHYGYPQSHNGGVIFQNYAYLKKCDLVLLNLDEFDDSIGSVWEVSMAWAEKKPVIAFGECEKWKDRPHFKSLITIQLPTVEEAVEYIKDMYNQ